MTTGERIRLIRKENHMNQTEFAPVFCALGITVCLFGVSMILSTGLWERSHE